MSKKTQKLGISLVDTNSEKQLMVDYVLQTWDGDKDSLRILVEQGFDDGLLAAKFWYGNVNNKEIAELIDVWTSERADFLKNINSFGYMYDDILKIPKNMLFNDTFYNREILDTDWNFENITNKNVKRIIKEYNIKDVKPKGFDDVEKSGKSAYEYFDNFTLDSEKLFKGHNSESAGGGGFHHNINLASMYYGLTEQGRKLKNSLYAYAFSHGLMIQDNNNGIYVLDELKRLKGFYNNKDYPRVTYLGDLTKISTNPIFNALMVEKYESMSKDCNSQKDLDELLEKKLNESEKYGLILLKDSNGNCEALKTTKIYTFDHFEKQMLENISKYNVSNNLANIEIKEIDRDTYNLMKKESGSKNNDVVIGKIEDFMNYKYPNKEEILEIATKRLQNLFNDINSGKPKESNDIVIKNTNYKKNILSVLKQSITIKQNKP